MQNSQDYYVIVIVLLIQKQCLEKLLTLKWLNSIRFLFEFIYLNLSKLFFFNDALSVAFKTQTKQNKKNVTEEDRERRLNTLYFPYHQAIDSFLEHSPSSLIFSIHSYTDQYEGTKRDVEAGLLFIEDETLAQKVLNILFILFSFILFLF